MIFFDLCVISSKFDIFILPTEKHGLPTARPPIINTILIMIRKQLNAMQFGLAVPFVLAALSSGRNALANNIAMLSSRSIGWSHHISF